MSTPVPPPPKLPVFDAANDVDTEPGIGIVALKQENARLRKERNEARTSLAAALAAAGGTNESEPPATRPSERVRRAAKAKAATLFTGKWALLLPLIILLARYAQKRWPQFGELIDSAVQALPQ